MRLPKANAILQNSKYRHYLKRIARYEKDRLFCRHDLQHFLDVARIACIIAAEKNYSINPDVIYATALLHDIGRFAEYEYHISHEEASLQLALDFIGDFSETEQQLILSAIRHHRSEATDGFSGIFYQADKASRKCFDCSVQKECNWHQDAKNFEIEY